MRYLPLFFFTTCLPAIFLSGSSCVRRRHRLYAPAAEAEYYRIITLPVPEGVALEAGALQWMGHGRLAASTRQGDIYMIDNTLEDHRRTLKFTQFAVACTEVLGLDPRMAGSTRRSAAKRRK